MVLHTRLPESLAGIPARHGELQRVLAQCLCGQGQEQGCQGRAGPDSAACPRSPELGSCLNSLQRPTYRNVCVELDEKMLPLETQFANFGPVECVDLCIALQGRTQQLYRDGARCRNTTGRDLGSQDTT